MRPYFLFIACLVPLLAQPPKPKHINRMIDVLEQGQPIYYDSSHGRSLRHGPFVRPARPTPYSEGGIAAYCCAHLLKAAGIRVSLDQTEIESVQRGLEWCARQLRNRNEFCYRLDGFELQAVN